MRNIHRYTFMLCIHMNMYWCVQSTCHCMWSASLSSFCVVLLALPQHTICNIYHIVFYRYKFSWWNIINKKSIYSFIYLTVTLTDQKTNTVEYFMFTLTRGERKTWAVAAQNSRARAAQVNREKNYAVSTGAHAARSCARFALHYPGRFLV